MLGAMPAAAGGATAANRELPDVMLQDGVNAAIDGDIAGARRIYGELISLYPRTPAAKSAQSELAKLDAAAGRGSPSFEQSELGEDDVSEGLDERLRKARFRFVSEVGDRVFFAENSAVIGGRARTILEAQARWLKKATAVNVTILGRADDGGSVADSAALARARAEAVRTKLVEAGLDASRVKIEARGNEDRIATCQSALCQAQNRHVETVLHFSSTATETRGAEAGRVPGRPLAR